MSGDSGINDDDAVEDTDGIDELFWSDEVLEAMYWMIGEGIQDALAPSDLRGFLGAPSGVVEGTIERLAEREYLRETAEGYVFTKQGEQAAARRFADEFGEMQGFDTAHNDCGPDCWCHDVEHATEPCPAEEHAH